jgi:hypothetical protein
MPTSSNHTEVSVHCCHGKHKVASSRTLLSDLVLSASCLCSVLEDPSLITTHCSSFNDEFLKTSGGEANRISATGLLNYIVTCVVPVEDSSLFVTTKCSVMCYHILRSAYMQVVRWRLHRPANSFESWCGRSIALLMRAARAISPVL